MKTADLYIRVSTDEQADKGYSQRDQEERLKKYCSQNNIAIGQVIFEDHSAKTFNRPAWIKLLEDLKKKNNKTNLVLFTKWDRFSRNAGDAYQMISILTKLGIEPQAVEQPLDLSIPENKMMLAIYLAAPEVENDRRALNTFYGMRRARKEGRLMGRAPYGYMNRSKEDGRKYIAVKEPEASALKWAFNEIAKGVLAADQVRQELNKNTRNRQIGKSNFHIMIRNPLYCGKIFIPKHKDEEAHFVKGQHEAIIDEKLFNAVQQILDGNRKIKRPNSKVLSDENLPLRGFLICPKCRRNLTGSASTGRNGRYYYYHCIASCGFRQKAEHTNEIFEKLLKVLEIKRPIKKILRRILMENYQTFVQNPVNEKKKIVQQIDVINQKLSTARNKLLSEIIGDEEYLEIKRECKNEIEKLEQELNQSEEKREISNIEDLIHTAIEAITNISKLYTDSGTKEKRQIIGSIFPEKLEFDGKHYRTARMNTVAYYIFQINNELYPKRNKTNNQFDHLSCLVPEAGIEPARPCEHRILNPARLPVPPLGLVNGRQI